MNHHLVNAYQSMPVSFTHGDGVYLWDDQGKRYLDALCGISVTNLGHNFPAVTEAIQQQASQLLHSSNLYRIEWQHKLADLLCEASGMERVFFGNSGAEANEAAIKLARLYGHQRGIKNPQIVVMENSFHGRTMATLSATGNRKVQAGFEPLVSGFVRAPYDDVAAIEAIAANNKDIVAILVEPVQGEGGIRLPDNGYVKALRDLCDRNEWLLMLDEVQTGMARSARMFAFQHAGIVPDVMTLAKALANGVPIGACVTHGVAAETIKPGNHGSTFGGNPLACRAAIATLQSMIDMNIPDNACARGRQLVTSLRQRLADNNKVVDVRHRGLLVGIELSEPCAEIVSMAMAEGLLVNVTASRVIRLLPPLILNETQIEQLADILLDCINRFTDR